MDLSLARYRDTLVAAALAVGSLACLPVADAHQDGWRGAARPWHGPRLPAPVPAAGAAGLPRAARDR